MLVGAPLLAAARVPFASALLAQAAPMASPVHQFYGGNLAVSGDWLQLNALPLDRNAPHSMAFDLSYRRDRWVVDGGFLRIARELSTVQGGFVSGGPAYHVDRFTFLPNVGMLVGEADVSTDSTGYDFVTPAGTPGHVPRYDFSSAATVGAGIGLTVEAQVYGPLAARVSAAQWVFSGTPVSVDRGRTLVGVGLSLRVW